MAVKVIKSKEIIGCLVGLVKNKFHKKTYSKNPIFDFISN